ncbi:bacteriophage protein [Pseudomonas aeruginosa]|nr:bacteriophage protein [Pseudomonas aeruginosa]
MDWDIVPPDNATAKEKEAAAALYNLMQGLDDFEEVIFDTTDAIGKGFACQEFDGWQRVDGNWLPKAIIHRPQSWFQLPRGVRQEIRLRGPSGGTPLQPFGWITHVHKSKSGYLERSALFRVLVWPYLFKNYSVGDLAEFLEIYGIPMRVGKYPTGATEKEKLTLLRALAALGHNAAGIIPSWHGAGFSERSPGRPGRVPVDDRVVRTNSIKSHPRWHVDQPSRWKDLHQRPGQCPQRGTQGLAGRRRETVGENTQS